MRITIVGNFGCGNLGDEAILSGLKTLILKKHRGAEITVLGKGKLLPIGLRSFLKSLVQWRLWSQPLHALKEADYVIIGGGGLFTDEESRRGTVLWTLHGIVAHFMGRKVLCLGVSIGKMGWLSTQLAKVLFRRALSVVVRDKKSLDRSLAWGIDAALAPDLALANDVQLESSEVNTASEKYVVINLREFKNYNEKMIQLFVQLADFLVADFGYKIVFLPLSTDAHSDSYILNKILIQMKHSEKAEVDDEKDTIYEIVNLMCGAELVISMRLHGSIFSILAEVPVLPIAYMDKVKNFWSGEQLKVTPLSVESITLEVLKKDVLEHLNSRERMQRNMRDYKKELAVRFDPVTRPIL
ncbi:hypothetical protein COV82_02940 [Candidatus Peregrinibacteria bacterium CG11_big_fil_rev_8_21_14_0_20_46_8]|nr:MAG: hypothetical protein COV82_02940 [Candidatus Peregrinibacteria bacterium CG11_big_fil_rev_8_21_14_0_20_46_8]